MSDGDALETLRQRMRPDAQSLPLSRAPIARLLIATNQHDAGCHALLQLHHLACDHESLETMFEETMSCMRGDTQALPEPVAYRNHVAQALAQARMRDADAFFRGKLRGVDEPTAPFGLLDVHGGGRHIRYSRQSLDTQLARDVRLLARRLRMSAATLFHAAWARVVACTSGRNDVVFGTLLLGRLQGSAGAQRTLGVFMNTLPVRLRLENVTTRELVEQTHRELTELLDYEQASLAAAQRCSDVQGSTPLFSALLNYRHSNPASQIESSAAAAQFQVLEVREWTNYPVTLSIDDWQKGFDLTAKTDSRVDPQRVLGYVTTAIRSLVDALQRAPQTPALELPILPDSERRQVIDLYNDTRSPYPATKLIHQIFEQQARNTPHAVALVCGSRSLSYAALNGQCNRLARCLSRHGVAPDERVGIVMERSELFVLAMLGTLKAGGAYVPLDPSFPPDRLTYLLNDAAPKVVLIQEKLRERLPAMSAPVISVDEQWSEIAIEDDADRPVPDLTPEHLAYLMYTSGSTGLPKGVMVCHRNVVNYTTFAGRRFDVYHGEGSLVATSLGFDLSLTGVYPPLLYGRTVRLCAEDEDLSQCLFSGTQYAPVKLTPTHLKMLSPPDSRRIDRHEFSCSAGNH